VKRETRERTFVLFHPAGGLNNASARTRVYHYLPHLEEHGVRFHVASYTWHKYDAPGGSGGHRRRGFARIWLELLPLRNLIAFLRADTLFFQKKSFSRRMVTWGKRLGKRIVYDFDDAIYLRTPDSAAAVEYRVESDPEFLPKMTWMLARCDAALVSGAELARFAGKHAPRTRVLPSVFAEIGDEPSGWHEPPVIGWVGAPENQRYLRTLEAVLLRLQREHPSLEVWIVTRKLMNPPPAYRHKFWPWSLEAEQKIIPRFTAAVAPLDDDAWCRAKMNFKALVCMSQGVPCVTSPVGFPLAEFEENRSALVARTEEDWYQHLKTLITDPARREQVAAEGLKVIRERFTAEKRVGEFVSALSRS